MLAPVLIAAGGAAFRERIRGLLTGYPGIDVVGEATTFVEMVQMAKRLKPYVIVVDLRIIERAPSDFRTQLPQGWSRFLAVSSINDVDAELLVASIGVSVLLDKMKTSGEHVVSILKPSAALAREVMN